MAYTVFPLERTQDVADKWGLQKDSGNACRLIQRGTSPRQLAETRGARGWAGGTTPRATKCGKRYTLVLPSRVCTVAEALYTRSSM